ncbi:MAG: phytanoyl-CoA dioxygenase family protein [Planctomycetaceae bacterium]|nr:phytanoyl-CoA dioxygenase family protein [Planctomycetaceae bacterium]
MSASAANMTDPYHSRQSEQWEAAERVDPVVWGQAGGPLSADQVNDFDRDGFLFLPGLLGADEVQFLLQEAKSLMQTWPDDSPGRIREPGSGVVRSLFRLHRHSDMFRRFFADDRVAGPAMQLLNSDVMIHQSRINYKPALDGREFFWHSDFETWHVEDGMPRMRAVSMSVFLTESHEFNGPLMLIPGSQRTYIRCGGATPEQHFEQSLRRQEYGVPTAEALRLLIKDNAIVAPKGAAGSVVFFDCNVMHGSAGNLSPTPRINLFAVYNSTENQLVEPFCEHPPRPEYLAERTPFVIARQTSAPH